MDLSPDFKEFIGLLNDEKVRYLVVGGYAVALHGHPRYTKDIDIWIERDENNVGRLMKALDAFGFGGIGLQADDFLGDDQIIQLGQPPNRIDLLTSIPGVEFAHCFASRVEVSMGDVDVHFIDLANLRIAKQVSGRYQDLADLENLQ